MLIHTFANSKRLISLLLKIVVSFYKKYESMKGKGYEVQEYKVPVKRYYQTGDLKDKPTLVAEYINMIQKSLGLIIVYYLSLTQISLNAQQYLPSRVHENVRETPYPQEYHQPYLNPAPLLVPQKMKQSDFLQFTLSKEKDFSGNTTLLSKPVPWCMFNPHQILSSGTWYWRFRSISKSGEKMPWSPVYSFTITDDIPRFVTPSFELLRKRIAEKQSRLYCFLEDSLAMARQRMYSHPEYNRMITSGREGLSADYGTDTLVSRHVSAMVVHCEKLHTAYTLLQRDVYADKMVQLIRWLLPSPITDRQIGNDFYAGDLAYLLACSYETCYERFTTGERFRIEQLMIRIINYYRSHFFCEMENHIFNNHLWQFTFRRLLQTSLVLYDKYPEAREFFEYGYELWTCRAPATGFNRNGIWINGTCYFSANAVSLYYIPSLFSYLSGTDFFQHPWYREAGKAMVYSWPPHSQSVGFGDGHEQMNDKPLIIRSAFADFLAREKGDPYAAWYTSIDKRYEQDDEMRLYRMVRSEVKKGAAEIPDDEPKARWFRDSGDMIANSSMKDYKDNLCLSFHSNPFGSGSHTHADQNAFNLHFRGVPVYGSTGYYMSFADAHNLLSYRHTRAHNTLLVDGVGQPFTTRAYGNIVRSLSGEHISYALGDASNAYCGISEYPMWIRNFADQHLEQSAENGFGETSLTLYRRHIFLLHPDKVLIYDEMEARKPVRWDWLLHSPTKFSIDERASSLVTRNEEKQFTAVAQLFSRQECKLTQTNRFVILPEEKKAVRGEVLANQWHLTASFVPSKQNRILTIIQIQPDGKQTAKVIRDGNRFQCDDWTIEVELDTKKAASLYILNNTSRAVFSYGKSSLQIDGKSYKPAEKNGSLLFDKVDGKWQLQEMTDRAPQLTGSNE